ARILLKADAAPDGPACTDAQIAAAVEVGVATVERARQQFVEHGLGAALARKPQDRPSRPRTLDGRAEAPLIPPACAPPPPGRVAWTLPSCWPTAWSSCASWRPSPTRRCGGCSKKRAEAVAEGAVVHPAGAVGGVRGPDGRPPRPVPPALRPPAAA